MTDANLAFAKLVSNPTASAWSQAYDAGKLFAVLSLETNVPLENLDELNTTGKDVLATLEQEFFTLENKDLDSIKRAIGTATARINKNLSSSFVIVYVVGNILYLFIYGKGKVVLKRGTKIGTLLEGDSPDGELKSASGYLQDKDVVILETDKFSKIISPQTLAMSLDNEVPVDIAEALAPNIHEKEDGAAASLFVEFKEDKTFVAALEAEGINPEPVKEVETGAPPPLDFDDAKEQEEVKEPESIQSESKPETPESEELVEEGEKMFTPISPVGFSNRRGKLSFMRRFSLRKLPLPHSRRMLLTIGIIVLVIFIGSIFLAINNKSSETNRALFEKVYTQAETKYTEGQGLVDLNKGLAREDFKSAQQILNDNKNKFKKGSEEEKQITDLLSKVNKALDETSGAKEVDAKEIDLDTSDYLSAVSKNTGSKYFTQNADSVFYVDSKGIQKIAKSTGTTSQLIAKDWENPGGIGVYLSNFYVLDKSDTILKFVATGTASKSAYVKSDYLTGSPSLDTAVAMAIDGSVYVLYGDGNIEKYNRGAKQTFEVSGLDKDLNKPTRIWTDTDTETIYILDNGNSRIIALNKEGIFQESYSSSLLKNAVDFEVVSKTINFLSGGKAYSLSI